MASQSSASTDAGIACGPICSLPALCFLVDGHPREGQGHLGRVLVDRLVRIAGKLERKSLDRLRPQRLEHLGLSDEVSRARRELPQSVVVRSPSLRKLMAE